MDTQHTKSPCCRAPIRRYGGRRRQCLFCLRTWRIYQKRKGRKKHRIAKNILLRTLINKESLKQQARRNNHLSVAVLSYRFRKALNWFVGKPKEIPLSLDQLVLIANGFWFRFQKKDWVLYLMAIKPIKDDKAILLDPLFLPGKEGYESWRKVIEIIPLKVKKQIKALISDNFRGAKRLVKEFGWIHQLCHFHLIAQLQIRRGRRKSTLGDKNIREEIYQSIRETLETTDEKRLEILKEHLKKLATSPDCPRKLAMMTHEFLREINSFRAYLIYPELNLPTTTNTIESIGKIIRNLCRNLNTPKSVWLWATAFIRLRSIATCNGKKNQPN